LERVTGQQRRGDLCYKVAKTSADQYSCSSVLWRVELVNNRDLAEEVSKQSAEGVA
jgi:hypothetical protein